MKIMPESPQEKASLLIMGAVGILLLAVLLVGVDYKEVRDRSNMIPTMDHRIGSVEESIKEASKEQTRAVRELSAAVIRLEQTIIRMEERQHR